MLFRQWLVVKTSKHHLDLLKVTCKKFKKSSQNDGLYTGNIKKVTSNNARNISWRGPLTSCWAPWRMLRRPRPSWVTRRRLRAAPYPPASIMGWIWKLKHRIWNLACSRIWQFRILKKRTRRSQAALFPMFGWHVLPPSCQSMPPEMHSQRAKVAVPRLEKYLERSVGEDKQWPKNWLMLKDLRDLGMSCGFLMMNIHICKNLQKLVNHIS